MILAQKHTRSTMIVATLVIFLAIFGIVALSVFDIGESRGRNE